LLHNVRGTLADRVLLVGLGKERDFREREFRTAMRAAVRLLNETGSYEAVVYLTEEKVKRREVAWRVEHALVVAMDAVYRFDEMKSQPADVRRPLRKLTLSVPNAATSRGRSGCGARAGDRARHGSRARSRQIFPQHSALRPISPSGRKPWRGIDFSCQVLDRPQLEELKMGSFPVGLPTAASSHPSSSSSNTTAQARNRSLWSWSGKALLSTAAASRSKPAHDMDQMKFDMCGAATSWVLFGRCRAQTQDQSGRPRRRMREHAQWPRDQAGRHRSQHVGANGRDSDTDAEGRLILCDALTYAERYGADAVVDIATLTGAMVIALGHIACGVFSNSDSLARALLGRGRGSVRPGLANAGVGGVTTRAQQQLRRLRQCRRTVPAAASPRACFLSKFNAQVRLGAPRHRGHRLEGRQGEGRNRAPRAAARDLGVVAGGAA